MLNVLIYSSRLSTIKMLTNEVISKIKEFRISGIITTKEEMSNTLKHSKPDLIFTTDKLFVIDLFNSFYKHNSFRVIFISSNEHAKFSNFNKNLLIIYKQDDSNSILCKLSNFINHNLICSRREKATNLLTKLGFNFKLLGTKYLLESILYAHSIEGAASFEKLQRDVYSYVAEQFNTTSDRVKWSIARSINYMYEKSDKNTYKNVERYFSITYPEKPTPKLIISFIANTLDTK